MLFWNPPWQWQNLFFLGPYPVGKTAKTSLPFRRALTAVSRSRYLARPAARCQPSSNLLTARPRQITSFPWESLSKINQWNEKMGAFVAGVPSSLAPSLHFSPAFLLPFPLPVCACYAGCLPSSFHLFFLQDERSPFDNNVFYSDRITLSKWVSACLPWCLSVFCLNSASGVLRWNNDSRPSIFRTLTGNGKLFELMGVRDGDRGVQFGIFF